MKEKIDQFIASKEAMKKELIKFCKDKSIPLQERWELFIKSDLGDISQWASDCKVIRDIVDEDDLTYEKYSTHLYKDIIDEWAADDKRKIEVQEYALKKFEKGFTYDW